MYLPRILIAGISSGSGKTTITCGILQALKDRGMSLASSKCGPDYIDPMFHETVLGTASNNLDAFFCKADVIRSLLMCNSRGADITVLEGVMGYYDGYTLASYQGSSYDIAGITNTPVILTVPCKGMGLSVVPVIQGMLEYKKDSRIKGVILNGITQALYDRLKVIIEQELPVQVLGYLPKLSGLQLRSRHLGLVTPQEIGEIKEQLQELGAQAEQSIDIEGILMLARGAEELTACETPRMRTAPGAPVRIGVAYDKAFCFYYKDNQEMLKMLGCELVPFSPLHDSALPESLQGLLLGGGYPELYAEELAANTHMKSSIRHALQSGLPCLAECGGFMYLQEEMEGADGRCYPMVGALKGRSEKKERLVRFGYIELKAEKDNFLQKKGDIIRGHEFHYWDSTDNGQDYLAVKPGSSQSFLCCHAQGHILAGYPHLHYYSNSNLIQAYVEQCKRRGGN